MLAALVGFAASSARHDSRENASARTSLIDVVDFRNATSGTYPEVQVAVLDNEFDPPAIRVRAGTTVVWQNKGRVEHDIMPVDRSQFTTPFGVAAAKYKPGSEYEYQFTKPGVYRYYCSLHGTPTKGMTGMVVVGDAPVVEAGATTVARTASGTVHVPADYPTIQSAVDAAKPGSLVLVAPGVYHEAVTVTSDDIVIRGEDRNKTIVDGQFKRDNGFKVLADGVAIENITARNFTSNAFYWTGVTGYRGSYLTSYRTGDYGIYAFGSTKGQFDHSYAAGSTDAGYYIGQCYPCDAAIDHVVAEWNGLGYSGTNVGGNLLIVNSEWRDNRAGIVPNSGTGEQLSPQHGATVAGNVVHDNNNIHTPAISIAQTALGNGILLAGGNDNLVEHNLVYGNSVVGIAPVPLPEKILNPDNTSAQNFDATGNIVRDNVVRGSGQADIANISNVDDPKDSGNNCFSGNTYATSMPANLQDLLPCGSPPSPAFQSDLARFASLLLGKKPPDVDYRTAPLPPVPTLENMRDPLHAPASPANHGVPERIDLASITTPAG